MALKWVCEPKEIAYYRSFTLSNRHRNVVRPLQQMHYSRWRLCQRNKIYFSSKKLSLIFRPNIFFISYGSIMIMMSRIQKGLIQQHLTHTRTLLAQIKFQIIRLIVFILPINNPHFLLARGKILPSKPIKCKAITLTRLFLEIRRTLKLKRLQICISCIKA